MTMVKFGETIVAQKQQSEWSSYFLNYTALKQVLDDYKQQQREQHDDYGSVSSHATLTNLLFPVGTHPVTADFLHRLHTEVERIVLFVLQEQGKIASELAVCREELHAACLENQHRQLMLTSSPLEHKHYDYPLINEEHTAEAEIVHSLEEKLCQVGLLLLKLYHFVDVNVTGIRKILKKHDKLLPRSKLSVALLSSLNNNNTNTNIGPAAVPPSPRRNSLFQRRKLTAEAYGNALVKPLLRDECLGALAVTLEACLQELHGLQYSYSASPVVHQQLKKSTVHQRVISAPPEVLDQWIRESYLSSNDSTDVDPMITPIKQTNVSDNHIGMRRDVVRAVPRPPPIHSAQIHDRKTYRSSPGYRSQSYSMMGGRPLISNADHILLQIQAARRRLQQTSSFVQLLAAPMLMHTSDGTLSEDGSTASDDEIDAADDEIDQVLQVLDDEDERPSNFSNTLNLCSTLLYMSNYYIVAPTSGTYAEKLGGTAAMASMIIGMTPVAALVSTVLFSWWTSHSYKSALIFASSCSAVGNLCYAAGLPCHSLTLVIIGRLLNGFGSARAINRRYIADTFPREERTAASAAFVSAGALGMSAGPAIASALNYFTTDQYGKEWNGNLYWQSENAPGWFMFGTWTVYLICVIRYFQDPPKKKDASFKKVVSSLELTEGETSHLLGTKEDTRKEHELLASNEPSIWCNVPVMTTLVIYFLLKLVLEAVLSSAAVVTKFYFGWHSGLVGMYLAALGLLMLPANLCVAYLARSYDDRELIIGFQLIMFLGCLVIMHYSDFYTLPQYMLGSVVLFISTNALEGPNMSLLSKTIPKSWSKGIFNVGLLATEAGTAGRAIGDVLLTVIGSGGLEHLINRTYGSFSLLSLITLLFSYYFYDHLQELSDQDD